MTTIRNLTDYDFESVVALNDAEVQQTSQMNLDQLGQLVQMSSYCKVAVRDDRVAAFIIALREEAPYQNDNYSWFASRFPKFLYVDRVVVESDFSGLKIGSMLYKDMFQFARSHAISVITCEYNIEPPNPPSRAFHDKFGFKQVGTQWVAGGSKLVSLQAAEI
jgi:uncharacterized protein